nr:hypothetical protein [Thermocrispum municipale]
MARHLPRYQRSMATVVS